MGKRLHSATCPSSVRGSHVFTCYLMLVLHRKGEIEAGVQQHCCTRSTEREKWRPEDDTANSAHLAGENHTVLKVQVLKMLLLVELSHRAVTDSSVRAT